MDTRRVVPFFLLFLLILASFLLVSLAPTVTAQEAGQGQALTHYRLEVELDLEQHTLTGSATITYYNDSESPISALHFILLPNFGRERNPYLDRSYIDRMYWNGFDPSWLEVEGVIDATGEPLEYELRATPPEFQEYSLEKTLLVVRLPEPLAPGESFKLKIDFTTKFPHMLTGDQAYHRDIYIWRFGWHPLALPAEMIEGDRFKEEEYLPFILPAAEYEAEITLPEGYTLAAGADEVTLREISEETPEPGRAQTGSKELEPANVGPAMAKALAEKVQNLSKKERRVFKLRYLTPVRSLPIAIGPEDAFKKCELTHNGVLIQVWYRPGREGAARQLATYVAEILDYYSERYGEYQHKRFVLIDAPVAGFWGMAADGFTAIGDSAFAEKDLGVPGLSDRLIEWLLAHELAHQWFGIGVGADFNAENWLSEGFAQYLSVSYFEEKYGGFGPNLFVFDRPGLLEKLIERELGFFNLRQHNIELPYLQVLKDRFDEPIIEPEKDVRYGNWSAIRIYDKGYLVLRALAGELGEEGMTELVREVYRRFNHRTLTVEELRRLAEELSGKNLEEFFQDWLYSAAWVDYAVERLRVEERDGKYLNKIYLSRRGEGVLPVEVVATTKAGEEIKQTWDGREEQVVLELETESPVKSVQLDPEELVPDANRLNNRYPLKLRVITTGKRDLPLDAYLLRFDPATGTLEGGTLWHRWLVGQNLGAFVVYLGRGGYLRGLIDLRPFDEYNTIAGALEWGFVRYSHPKIGLPGRYWEPRDRFRLTLGREVEPLDAQARGINYLSLGWQRIEQMNRLYSTELELTLGLSPEFARLALSSYRPFRLAPHLYLEPSAEIGLGFNLPEPFQFTLEELHSFYRRVQDEGCGCEQDEQAEGKGEEKEKEEKLLFPGEVKFLTRLALRFPVRREMDYDLLNLALIDETREVVFLQFGNTWPSLAELDLNLAEFKLEGGVEAITRGRTLGGLMPFTFRIGFAYPFWGGPPDRQGRVYASFEMPLF